MIKLFATDLDGTLVDHDGRIAAQDVAAVRRAREMGVAVVVATGRMPTSIDHFLDMLGVGPDEFVVGAQGAMITRGNGRILHTINLERDIVQRAAAIARELGAVPVYFTTEFIAMERVVLSVEQDRFWMGDTLRYDADALDHISADFIKVLAAHPDEAQVPGLQDVLNDAVGAVADVVRSYRLFVEVLHKRANKGAAIAWIAQELGIARDEVLAIGDAGNDVSMLRWAGHSAAPADAAAEARAAADWQAPSMAEHAVAATLEHFVFGPAR